MCMAAPMEVVEVQSHRVRCVARGAERWADTLMLADAPPRVGDYVILSRGAVQRILDPQEAAASWALWDEIFAVLDAAPGDPGGHSDSA